MDKINIASSQAPPLARMCSKSSSPLVSSLVKNRLFEPAPDIDELPFQFIIHTISISISFSVAQTPTVRPRALYIVIISCVIRSSMHG